MRTTRRRSFWKRQIRPLLPRVLLGLAIVVVLSGVWLTIRGLEARRDLRSASSGIAQVRADLLAADTDRASADLLSVQRQTAEARSETHDPIWTIAGHIPFAGRPVRAVAGLTRIANGVTHTTFPTLVRTAGVVSSQRIKIDHGSVDLSVLSEQSAPLSAADADARRYLTEAEALPSSDVGPIHAATVSLTAQLTALSREVHAAAVTASIGPTMLGGDGPRTYFVAFQNSAEARGTGGIAGAYVILRADVGHLSVLSQGSDADLSDNLTPVPIQGASALALSGGADRIWRNANVGADFPTAAAVWVRLWQEQTGQRLDGAFAIDPTVLSYVLAVTGPATLSDGQTVDAGNAVSLTEQKVYDTFDTDQADRKSFLQLVSSATIDKALAAPASAGQGLLQALRRGAGEHRVLFYSTDPGEQAQLATTPAGGNLPSTAAPTAIAALVNASGNKVDYYVRSALTYRASSCAGSTRDSTVSLSITNDAPTSGLSTYVGERLDPAGGPAGSEISIVSYYATAGAQVLSATLDGKPTTVNISTAEGHPVFTVPMTLLPGGVSHTLVLHLTEPVLDGPVQTRPQALVQPQTVSVDAPVCRS